MVYLSYDSPGKDLFEAIMNTGSYRPFLNRTGCSRHHALGSPAAPEGTISVTVWSVTRRQSVP